MRSPVPSILLPVACLATPVSMIVMKMSFICNATLLMVVHQIFIKLLKLVWLFVDMKTDMFDDQMLWYMWEGS